MTPKQIKYKTQVTKFIAINRREPTVGDFNKESLLPSVKTIQRHFGSLTAFRQQMGYRHNYKNFEKHSKKFKEANRRAQQYEKELYEALYEKYHDTDSNKISVYRELEYHTYHTGPEPSEYIRSDVALVDRETNHIVFVDFFYASDIRSAGGCIRIKTNKIKKNPFTTHGYTYEIVFVCTNEAITQDMINGLACLKSSPAKEHCSLANFKAKWEI